MKHIVIASLLVGAFALTAGADPVSAQPLNVSVGSGLPVGMTVYVTVGGDGSNCVGGKSGVVGRNGRVTVTFEMHCDPSGTPPSPGPNSKTVVMARGLDEKTDTQYRGSGVISRSIVGAYSARFAITP
jgi:hypothetical protein